MADSDRHQRLQVGLSMPAVPKGLMLGTHVSTDARLLRYVRGFLPEEKSLGAERGFYTTKW